MSSHFFTVILIIGISAILAYRSPYLKNKQIYHLSLLQIIYLVILPGIAFTLLYSFMKSITSLPHATPLYFPDTLLEDVFLLSLFFTYGGIAIHAVTKMLSETSLRHNHTDAAELNRFFHEKFSHNLSFSGISVAIITLAILDINHSPTAPAQKMSSLILKGVLLGIFFVVSMYNYTLSNDNYYGRWADLKAVFLVAWMSLGLFLYILLGTDSPILQHQIFLPVFTFVLVVSGVGFFLTFRRIKRLLQINQ